MDHLESIACNKFTDKVVVNGDVLHMRVKNWVGTKASGSDVVGENLRERWKLKAEFMQQVLQPKEFSDSGCNGMVFSLSGGPSN